MDNARFGIAGIPICIAAAGPRLQVAETLDYPMRSKDRVFTDFPILSGQDQGHVRTILGVALGGIITIIVTIMTEISVGPDWPFRRRSP